MLTIFGLPDCCCEESAVHLACVHQVALCFSVSGPVWLGWSELWRGQVE